MADNSGTQEGLLRKQNTGAAGESVKFQTSNQGLLKKILIAITLVLVAVTIAIIVVGFVTGFADKGIKFLQYSSRYLCVITS